MSGNSDKVRAHVKPPNAARGRRRRICAPSHEEVQRKEQLSDVRSLPDPSQKPRSAVWAWRISSNEMIWSSNMFRLLEQDPRSTTPSVQALFSSAAALEARRLESLLMRCVQDQQPLEVEYSVAGADVVTKRLLCSAHPMFSLSGDLSGYLGSVRDCTEERERAEALRRARLELTRMSRVLTMGQMATSIAHEVNQPMAAVVANAHAGLRWLRRPRPNISEARKSMSAIVRDATRASEVIARVRALARRGTDAVRKPLSINEVVRQVVELMSAEILRHGVALRLDLGDGVPLLYGDSVQLQQVVLNLIVNALEAMADIPKESRALAIRTQLIGERVTVAVIDSGPGISGDIERLFQPFYSTKTEGIGIGLAISHAIVVQHGGALGAERNETGGATFRFELPAM
jgi:C4-dicarboxylate-specific signal transduction histidine kinase